MVATASIVNHTAIQRVNKGHKMKATFVKSGFNYLPAIKCSYSGNVKVLHGDRLATAATAKKYAQIEINRLNGLNRSEVTAWLKLKLFVTAVWTPAPIAISLLILWGSPIISIVENISSHFIILIEKSHSTMDVVILGNSTMRPQFSVARWQHECTSNTI